MIALLLTAGWLGPAGAQDDDWTVVVDSDRKLTTAAVAYTGGVLLRVECLAGQLAVGLSGLPARTGSGRLLERTLNDGRVEPSYWILSDTGTALTSALAARAARSLRPGGRLVLASPRDDTPSFRVQLDLPPRSTGIDTVLTACGRPVVDPRDDIPSAEPFLEAMPAIEASFSARRYRRMVIEISCLIAESRLSACRSDHQMPRDESVGRETALRAEGKRVRFNDPAAAEGRRVDIVVTTFRR